MPIYKTGPNEFTEFRESLMYISINDSKYGDITGTIAFSTLDSLLRHALLYNMKDKSEISRYSVKTIPPMSYVSHIE